jgi:outer membrane protein TolC
VGKSRYFPTVDVQANYYQTGEDWDLDGGGGVFEDPSSWDISAMASWTLWEWGRRYHDIRELKSELARAKYRREQTIDEIELEVKQSYLNTKQAEQNIIAVQKAVEQAKESFRITDKRYKEQMATTTDVLDAQTLLSKTMTNYYNALYDFKIAKATLFRAMGLEVYE